MRRRVHRGKHESWESVAAVASPRFPKFIAAVTASAVLGVLGGGALVLGLSSVASAQPILSISGTVTNTTGAPLQGIDVQAFSTSGNGASVLQQTDSSGDYTLSLPAAGSYNVDFWGTSADISYLNAVYNAGAGPTYVSIQPGTSTPVTVTSGNFPLPTVELTPGIALNATLQDATTGDPVPGICSWAWTPGTPGPAFTAPGSDSSGALSLVVTPGEYDVVLAPCGAVAVTYAGGFYDSANPPSDLTQNPADATLVTISAPSLSQQLGTIELEQDAGSITGTVTDTQGNPLSGLCVTPTGLDGLPPWVSITPSSGTFEIGSLAPGSYTVNVGSCSSSPIPYVSAYLDTNNPPTNATEALVDATAVTVAAGDETDAGTIELPYASTTASVVNDAATGSTWTGAEGTGASAYDTATVSGVSGVTPTGTVTYDFFTNWGCLDTASWTDAVTLSGGSVPISSATGPLAAGSYSFSASYSGDGNYASSSSDCEQLHVGLGASTTATAVDDAATGAAWTGTEMAGASAYDTATVSGVGGIPPSGTVAYSFFTNGSCTGTASWTEDVPIPSGVASNSDSTGPLAAGSYSFSASYFGDVNYLGSSSACEPFTVVGQSPTFTSAATAYFGVLEPGSFTVSASGVPTPAITMTGSLPAGLSFKDNRNGTATISGTPSLFALGTYHVTLTAKNGTAPNATQNLTIVVGFSPIFLTPPGTVFSLGHRGVFVVGTLGDPCAVLTGTGLPSWLTLTGNGNGTAVLSGTPPVGSGSIYTFTLMADNGVGTAQQRFTLIVNKPAGFTAGTSATFVTGQPSARPGASRHAPGYG